GAMEGLDNMVNDALYGILYRDINMLRTLIDQRVSRMINGYFGIVINTGEDNYLRTADAVDAAPSVTASQFINHRLALDSGLGDEQIAIGDAFEIDPPTRNGLLLEWAQAQLTRELFPDCPVKFMPPTRHMDGNLYRTHACDTLFNLVTIATGQGIRTAGVPTEGVFTPHLHDRVVGLECVDYVFNYARDIGEEIRFKPGGIIQTRAHEVLRQAHELLERIADVGMVKAIEDGIFGDVRRRIDEGRGMDGIVATEEGYFNPTVELRQEAGVVYPHARDLLNEGQALRRPPRRRDHAAQLHPASPPRAGGAQGRPGAGRQAWPGSPRGRASPAPARRLHPLRGVRTLPADRRLQLPTGRRARPRVHERRRDRGVRQAAHRASDRRRRGVHRLGHPQRRDRRDARPQGLPRQPRARRLPGVRRPQPRQPGPQQRAGGEGDRAGRGRDPRLPDSHPAEPAPPQPDRACRDRRGRGPAPADDPRVRRLTRLQRAREGARLRRGLLARHIPPPPRDLPRARALRAPGAGRGHTRAGAARRGGGAALITRAGEQADTGGTRPVGGLGGNVSLAELIAPGRRLAFVGLAKNTGKTETLKCALRELQEAGLGVGVPPGGGDGEERDAIDIRVRKPRIELPSWSLVATTDALLRAAAVAHEPLVQTDIRTPLGRVVVARMLSAGTVEIAGPSAAEDVRTVADAMLAHGAEQVLIDGAVDRRAA